MAGVTAPPAALFGFHHRSIVGVSLQPLLRCSMDCWSARRPLHLAHRYSWIRHHSCQIRLHRRWIPHRSRHRLLLPIERLR